MQQSHAQHGEFTLSVSGNVVIANLTGGWNREAALAFDGEFRRVAKPLIHSNWGHLVMLDDWSLGVPEMKPVIAGLVQWCSDNGLKRVAHVYSPSMLKKLQLDDLVVETGDFKRHAFACNDDAIQWLAAEGYPL